MCFCETILTEVFPNRLLTNLDISLQELLNLPCLSLNGAFFWPTVFFGLYIPTIFWARPVKKRARLLTPTFLGPSRQETRWSSSKNFFGGRTDKKRACLLTPSFLGASRQETRWSSYTNFFGPVPSRNAVVFLQKLFWGRTDKKRACILTLSCLGTSRPVKKRAYFPH